MRILHVYKDYYPVLGGIENHIRALAEVQARRGHTVTVLVTNRDPRTVEEVRCGVNVVKARRLATVASTPLSPELVGRLRSLRPDITHLHSPYPVGEIAQWLASLRSARRPYVVTYHADVTRPVQRAVMRVYWPVFRRVLENAARVLVTSSIYAGSSPYLRGLALRLAVVPLGSDPVRFTPGQRAAGEPFTILFVGLLRHYKGVDDLLHALALLPSGARLVIAGEGPMQVEWEALCRRLNLGSRATFLGRVPDEALPDLYRSADVFALPATTRAEAFGLVLAEAMLSGLACVTTQVDSGTSHVVQDGLTGLVVPPHSPQTLAAALGKLMGDPGLRAQMGAAGRERALREFTVDAMAERVEQIYHAALTTL